MEKILKIEDFEDKKTTSGKNYVRFKTSDGWMSCFDTESGKEIKKLVGKSAKCVVIQQGNFMNIKKFIGESEPSEEKVEVVKVASETENDFPDSMKVSYAKDIFCSVCSRISQAEFDRMEEEERLGLMDLAVKAVKKAESEFKFP